MKKRMFVMAAAAAMALSLTAGPAFAGPPGGLKGGGDGACVSAGVKVLKGAIGPAAVANPPGTIAAVILAHTNGLDPLTGACTNG
jgi:hypothetical protein